MLWLVEYLTHYVSMKNDEWYQEIYSKILKIVNKYQFYDRNEFFIICGFE